MKKQILSLAAGAALLFAAQSSFAGGPVAGGLLNYAVILNGGCTVTTAASGTFTLADKAIGTFASVANVAAGSVVVKCSNTLPYAVCVDGGGPSWIANTRQLVGDGVTGIAGALDFLAYELKDVDNGGALVGDNGCGGIESTYADTTDATHPYISGTGTSLDITHTLVADVTIPAASVPGKYVDTVTVAVVW